MATAEQVLRQYFGYDTFRPGQDELVQRILAGRDVLGVMPTGAGKSICYQVPAMVLPGITLVVSPLISLMRDQVGALTEAGVSAACISSAQSPAEQSDTLYAARQGQYKLLYIAPERLMTPEFLEFAQQAPLAMLTVDEAHCISQWGQDFRPSYLQILDFLNALPRRPLVSAFTATATAAVREDIVRTLALREPFTLVTGFDRENLYFSVLQPQSKPHTLLRLVAERPTKSGIVYCATRKTVEQVCDLLCAKGIAATRYHAGLSADERQRNQDAFLYDTCPIIVATNAFGMGIDKSNVSFVIHYNMPKNMESYYQEAGRAGRDGEPADCILLYSGQDVHTARFLIERSHETQDEQLDADARQAARERDFARLSQMTHYATATDCLRHAILRYFGESTPPSCGRCGNCDTVFEQLDMTVDAQKALSCVYRLAERGLRFGRGVVIAVLRGSKNEKVTQFGLDTLSTYGLLQASSAARVRLLLDTLVERGYLSADPDRYNVLLLTEQGNALMRGRDTLIVKLPREKPPSPKKRARAGSLPTEGEANADLFDVLRALRSRLATEAHVPPYVIFSNATLADMAARQPITDYEFLEVRGVGDAKAARYGAVFVEAIKAHLAAAQ